VKAAATPTEPGLHIKRKDYLCGISPGSSDFRWQLRLPVLNAMWFEMTEDQKLRDQLMNDPNAN